MKEIMTSGTPNWMLAQALTNPYIPMKINAMYHYQKPAASIPYLFGCGMKHDQANISPFYKFSYFFRIKDPGDA